MSFLVATDSCLSCITLIALPLAFSMSGHNEHEMPVSPLKREDDRRSEKRSRDSTAPSPSKRRRSDSRPEVTLSSKIRMLIKQLDVGLIIGRSGENINNLRKKYDCTIDIPNVNVKSSERILCFEPHLTSEAESILAELLPKMGDRDSRDRESTEIILLVPQADVGAVLGKGGEHVKDLRKLTGAKIRIDRDTLPNSNERPVFIKGKYDEVCDAFRCILDDIEEKIKERGEGVNERRTILYDPASNVDATPRRYYNQHNYRSSFVDILEPFRRKGEPLFILDRSGRLIPLDKDDQIIPYSEAERMGLLGRDLVDREESSLVDLYLDDRRSRRELEKIYATSPDRDRDREERLYRNLSRRDEGSSRSYSLGGEYTRGSESMSTYKSRF